MSNLRQKLLDRSAKSFRTKLVTIGEGPDADTVEVRAPSVGQSAAFASAAQGNQAADLMATLVISCTFDPATKAAVFTAADRDLILESPAQGGWVSPITEAVMELMDDAKAAAKN